MQRVVYSILKQKLRRWLDHRHQPDVRRDLGTGLHRGKGWQVHASYLEPEGDHPSLAFGEVPTNMTDLSSWSDQAINALIEKGAIELRGVTLWIPGSTEEQECRRKIERDQG